jgi:hypothetical protein
MASRGDDPRLGPPFPTTNTAARRKPASGLMEDTVGSRCCVTGPDQMQLLPGGGSGPEYYQAFIPPHCYVTSPGPSPRAAACHSGLPPRRGCPE